MVSKDVEYKVVRSSEKMKKYYIPSEGNIVIVKKGKEYHT